MHTIFLILKREYLTRVQKKSFIVMTILGPILIAAMYAGVIYLAVNGDDFNDEKKIAVLNDNTFLTEKLEDSKTLKFDYVTQNLDELKETYENDGYDYFLFIPDFTIDDPTGIKIYGENQASRSLINTIEKSIKGQIEDLKLIRQGIDQETLSSLKARVDVETIVITDEGEQAGSSDAAMIVGLIAGVMIYMFIFLYGIQVMRGVIEEKTNRIVEVIISSVKPFQLMMGKILGIAAVGLTQFVLWIVLAGVLTTVVSTMFMGDIASNPDALTNIQSMQGPTGIMPQPNQIENKQIAKIFEAISSVNFPLIIGCFLFYFLGGYLVYSALFAAVGSAVDSESETQQFLMPITIPLIFTFIVSQSVIITNPDGPLAFWLSMIPFCSPIAMMVRLPFGVPAWEIALSMVLLVGGFIFTVWVAAKIYRTGILLYGKKVTYKEIGKWLFYKS
ncbi:MAG: ABC-2 type transport system permease protein [Sphingobacteriales bacterium]|jgi:ABC-2 type transport system permease protein